MVIDLPWGDKRSTKFVTNVGLITSKNKKNEDNVMACEFTHHINYKPGVIAIGVNPKNLTHDNISKTKQFGVSLASSDQRTFASLAGGTTGRKIDKVKYLKSLGYKFFKAKEINCLMVANSALYIECKLMKKIKITDHTLFIGKVMASYIKEDKKPLVYHKGKYLSIGKELKKTLKSKRKKLKEMSEKFAN